MGAETSDPDRAREAATELLDVLRAEMRTTDDSDDGILEALQNALLERYGADVIAAGWAVLAGAAVAETVAVSDVEWLRAAERASAAHMIGMLRAHGANGRCEHAAFAAFDATLTGAGVFDPAGLLSAAHTFGLNGTDLAWGTSRVAVDVALTLSVRLEGAAGQLPEGHPTFDDQAAAACDDAYARIERRVLDQVQAD